MEGTCLEVKEPTACQCLTCTYASMAENVKALAKLVPNGELGTILLTILANLATRVKGLYAFIEQNYPEEVKELKVKAQHTSGGE